MASALSFSSTFTGAKVAAPRAAKARATPARLPCVAAMKVLTTKTALAAEGGRTVVKLESGDKILIQMYEGEVYAVSNKCSHLGLPLQGKVMNAGLDDGCVVCAAHGTKFDLATGAVKGEWCPKLPNLPLIGKGPPEKALPTYKVNITEAGEIEVDC